MGGNAQVVTRFIPTHQSLLGFTLAFIVLAAAPLTASVGEAPDPAPPEEQTSPTKRPEASSDTDNGNERLPQDEEPKEESVDPCLPPRDLDDTLIDRVDHGLYTAVCASARWFDSFFGDARAHDEASKTYGTVSLSLKWTEYDEFEPILRGRVNIDLPNAKRKFDLFVGRLDPEEYLADTDVNQGPISQSTDDDENQWMVGLGYTPLNRRTQRLNLSVGVRVDWPLDPYAKAQYRWYRQLGDNFLFRYRQTGFWYLEDGFGTTTNLDLEHRPRPDVLIRTSTSATVGESIEGVKWWAGVNAFRQLAEGRAIGARLWAKGETEAPVEIEEYALWCFFRRRLHREWFYGDIATGITWPQEDPAENREASWGIALGVQIQFGDVLFDPEEG